MRGLSLRSLGLATLLLGVAAAGCLDEAEPGTVEETPPPPAPAPPELLYLAFPDPCPDNHTGNTTYNLTAAERRSTQTCGPSRLERMMNPGPCATFHVHDTNYTVMKGDTLHAGIDVVVGPTLGMDVYFTWRDTRGVIATFTRPIGFFPGESSIPMELNTTVLRDSTGQIFLTVQVSNDHCGGVGTKGTFPSFFEVNADTPFFPRRGQA